MSENLRKADSFQLQKIWNRKYLIKLIILKNRWKHFHPIEEMVKEDETL